MATRTPVVFVVRLGEMAATGRAMLVETEQQLHRAILTNFGTRLSDRRIIVCFDGAVGRTGQLDPIHTTQAAYYRTEGLAAELGNTAMSTRDLGLRHRIAELQSVSRAQFVIMHPLVRFGTAAIDRIVHYLNDYERSENATRVHSLKGTIDAVYAMTPVEYHTSAQGAPVAPTLLEKVLLLFAAAYILMCANVERFTFRLMCMWPSYTLPAAEVILMGAAPGDLRRKPRPHVGYLGGSVRTLLPWERVTHVVADRLQYRALTTGRFGNIAAYVLMHFPFSYVANRMFIVIGVRLLTAVFSVGAVESALRVVPSLARAMFLLEPEEVAEVAMVFTTTRGPYYAVAITAIVVAWHMHWVSGTARRVFDTPEPTPLPFWIVLTYPLWLSFFLVVHPLLWLASIFGYARSPATRERRLGAPMVDGDVSKMF